MVWGILALGPLTRANAQEMLMKEKTENLIPNGDFQAGELGELPDGWQVSAARPVLLPVFRLEEKDGEKLLLATGSHDECVGYLHRSVPVTLGKTYLYRVVFRMSEDLNPHRNLLFRCVRPNFKDGIFKFQKLEDGWVEGQEKIHYPGEGTDAAEVQIFFRYSAAGKAWIKEVSLTETEPVQPRWVKVACTQGQTNPETCAQVLEMAGQAGVDLVLLPEYLRGGFLPEPVPGPSSQLMSEMARRYRMYVAGGIVRQVSEPDRLYNTCLLFDRQGELVGMYDKVHPYSPENNEQGITPGTRVPVFDTDFGRLGILICYDSWFPDVCQLLALKGAEIILFPNAGHQPEFLSARAGDNRVRLLNSSWNNPYSIHDTLGRNILKADEFETSPSPNMQTFKDVVELDVPGSPVKILMASLDLNCSPSPAYNGGTMMAAPGGRRNRFETTIDLQAMIRQELERWWEE